MKLKRLRFNSSFDESVDSSQNFITLNILISHCTTTVQPLYNQKTTTLKMTKQTSSQTSQTPNLDDEILKPEFKAIEKTVLNFNNKEIECFLLDGVKYAFGYNLCEKIGKNTSSLYASIRNKTDWNSKPLFKLDRHKNTDTILSFMSYRHQSPVFVVCLTDEFLKWLINHCNVNASKASKTIIAKRPCYSGVSRVVVSGELRSQMFYQINDYWYYLFTMITTEKMIRRFIFMTDATTFLAKNIYNFTKGYVKFYTPDSDLKSELKISGLLSDNSNNQNLIDFDDEIFWTLVYSKFGINKPIVDESSEVPKDQISYKIMRKNNRVSPQKPKNDANDANDANTDLEPEPIPPFMIDPSFPDDDDEVHNIALSSDDYEDNNNNDQNDLDYTPHPSKKAKIDYTDNLQLGWSSPQSPPSPPSPPSLPSLPSLPYLPSPSTSTNQYLWIGSLTIDGAKYPIPMIAKNSPSYKLTQNNWPTKIVPIGICSAKVQKFANEISNGRFFTFEFDSQSPSSLPIHFQEFLKIRDTMIQKSSALVVQLENNTIIIMFHDRQLIGLFLPKMNLFHKSMVTADSADNANDKFTIAKLQSKIRILEAKEQQMEKTIENQSKILFQISSLLKSSSISSTTPSALSSVV